jgi:glutamine synthetase adenylyltransferase
MTQPIKMPKPDKEPIKVKDDGTLKMDTNVQTEVKATPSVPQQAFNLMQASAVVEPTLKVAPDVVDTALNPRLGGAPSGSSVQNMLQLDQSLLSNLRFLRDDVPRVVLRANRRFKTRYNG